MDEKEKFWIKELNSQNKKIGYNISEGGTGGNNYLHLTEDELKAVKKKISISVKRAI